MVRVRVRPRQLKSGKTRYYLAIVRTVGGREVSRDVAHAHSKADAQTLKRRLERKLQEERAGVLELNPTLAQAFDAYLAYMEGRSSHRSVKSAIERHLRPALGHIRLAELEPADIESYLDEKEQAGLSGQSLNHHRAYISASIKCARRRKLWLGPVDQVSLVETRQAGGKLKEILSPEEVDALLPHAPLHRQPLIGLALETLCRPGELFAVSRVEGLRARDDRVLFVRRSHGRDRTKTGKERAVPLTARALEWLDAALKLSEGSEWLFPVMRGPRKGQRQRESTKLASMIRSAMAAAGVGVLGYTGKCRRRGCGSQLELAASVGLGADVRCAAAHPAIVGELCGYKLQLVPRVRQVDFYSLRHAGATRLHRQGVPDWVLQDLLGHHSFRVSRRHYLVHTADDVRELLERATRHTAEGEENRTTSGQQPGRRAQ